MTHPLSPAAQAVLKAANGASSYGPDDWLNDAPEIAVATIRALADQAGSAKHWHATDLRILADELEEQG